MRWFALLCEAQFESANEYVGVYHQRDGVFSSDHSAVQLRFLAPVTANRPFRFGSEKRRTAQSTATSIEQSLIRHPR